MKSLEKLRYVVAAAALLWGAGVGAALAQVEQAHLRIDGMT